MKKQIADFNYLLKIAYNLLGNWTDAEDAVQEAVTKFLENQNEKPETIHNPKAYLAKVTYRTCIDQLRQQQKISLWENVEQPQTYSFIHESEDPFSQEKNSALEKWIDELSPQYRLVLHLKYYEGNSYEEIAEIFGNSVNASKQMHHRAIKNLRKISNKMSPLLVQKIHNGPIYATETA